MFPLLDQLQAPLAMHHALDEALLPFSHSRALAGQLEQLNKAHELFEYQSDKHLLQGEDFNAALQRDVDWFRQASEKPGANR